MTGHFALVGPGRAGRSIAAALVDTGWTQTSTYHRGDSLDRAAHGVDLVVIATPDSAIADVARQIAPGSATLLHLSGATPLRALGDHRSGALHPLVALADPETGAHALRSAWFAVAGDPIASEIAESLSGKWFALDDADRVLYHAAAVVGSNHLVALLGQVERMAGEIDVPLDAFMALARSSLENVAQMGAEAALTGPAARGDEDTIERHRQELTNRLPAELSGYDAMLELARRLVRSGNAGAD